MKDLYYESRYTFDPARSVVWKEIVRYLRPYISPDATVLDLGAGYCDFINNVEAQKKYAVDISPELKDHAAPGIILITGGGWDWQEIPDESVDVVFASNFLEHFDDEDLRAIMTAIRKVLKPSGTLILLQPNYRFAYRTYFDDPTHKKVFSDASLESFLVSHRMRVVLKKPRFLPFSMRSNPTLIPRSSLRLIVRAYIHSPLKPFAGQMLFVAEKS